MERIRQRAQAVGQQVAQAEQRLQTQAQVTGRLVAQAGPQPQGQYFPVSANPRSPVSAAHIAPRLDSGSSVHTRNTIVDMEMTGVVSDNVQEEEAHQNSQDGPAAGVASATLRGVQGFLSSLLGHVVGHPQADPGQGDEESGQVGRQEDGGVAGRVEDEEAGLADSLAVGNNTTSRLIPNNFFDSPDVPARRHQPVRKGRPESYKI